MLNLYEELKGWQNAIGSLLGFVALMVAALWNFQLNRKRDKALREEEALSVAAALYGEISLLRNEVTLLARTVANMAIHEGLHGGSKYRIDAHFLEAHQLSEPMLYKALSSRIGLLSPDLVIALTEFYGHYQEAKTSLPLLVEKSDRPYSYGASSFLVPARDAVKNVVPALIKIEKMVSATASATDLNLGRTEEFIEYEKFRHEG